MRRDIAAVKAMMPRVLHDVSAGPVTGTDRRDPLRTRPRASLDEQDSGDVVVLGRGLRRVTRGQDTHRNLRRYSSTITVVPSLIRP